ncbi:MAG: S1/P1 Nuclease, partial [Alistipes sp.]|nr:S1/P1 Nuclease [Alistipes sp.]
MKKSLLLILCALFLGAMPAYGWGRLGHSTIAKIAEDYLTPKAKKTIDNYLNGQSIIHYASYPDDYRSEHLIDIGFDATNCPRKTVWGHSFQALKDGSLYRSERRGNEYVKNCLLRID